nr:hypothetical protein [Tanacetum cinerariifolium]
MKHEKGTDEEADSFDDQLDTPDEVEDSSDEEVESTDEEEDTSNEDYELELKKKSNSKDSSDEEVESTDEEEDTSNEDYKLELKKKSNSKGYESEKYSDAEDAAGTNHSVQKLRYFDVDLTVKKLVMHRLGQLLRNFIMKLREKHILPNLNTPSKLNRLPTKYSAIVKAKELVEFVNYMTTNAYKEKSARGKMIENKEIEADEEPPCGIMWLKGRVNKDEEFPDDDIRSVGDKLKEADDKIKEGTLNLDDGTDAMTVVFGKENGGYAREVGSGVTYKRYCELPRSRQVTDERIELLQTQLDNERSERQQKDILVTPMAINIIDSSAYKVDRTQSSVVVLDKDTRIQKKSNGVVTSEKVMETMDPVKTVRPKKTPKSR